MKFFRRAVVPSLWLVLGAVIAAALVKIAFIDGVKGTEAAVAPQIGFEAPMVPAGRATVTNLVELKGSVQADPVIPVRSTEAGTVVYLYISQGKPVAEGTPLFQVRKVRESETDTTEPSAEQPDSKTPAKPAAVQYDYLDVLAPAPGVLKDFTALLGQQVTVGESLGSVDPGTFSVTGTLDAQQQYRLLDRPAKAEVTVTGGPAPFMCSDVSLGKVPETSGGKEPAGGGSMAQGPGQAGSGSSDSSGSATGTVTCPVPGTVKVFPGLGATLKLTAGVAENVLAVPLTAVKGSFQEGTVWVKSQTSAPDGAAAGADAQGASAAPAGFEERKVSLGLSDGVQIQVTKGLKEGEQILEFLPGVPAPPGPGGPSGANYAPGVQMGG